MSLRAPRRSRPSPVVAALGVGLVVAGLVAGVAFGAVQSNQAPQVAQPSTADVRTDPSGSSSAGRSLVFSTFLGGRFWDQATDVESDAAGNTYVSGFTLSPTFPVRNAAQRKFGGLVDAFVAKLAPGGRGLLWSTFLGGQDIDLANSLAVDRLGNVYVAGRTGSVNFPTTRGSVQPRLNGRACQGEPCHDAFVTKIDPRGRVLYSTFLGGSTNEEGVGIAVDRNGNAYVTGNTDSPDFPVRAAVQRTFQSLPCQGDLPCPYDVFVSKLSPNGANLSYSTYLGGRATEVSGGIAVDPAGSAYVTGSTRSADFPAAGAFQGAVRGIECGPPPGVPCLDAFVTKFSSGGNRLTYSTLLGGAKSERGNGIAVDSRGEAVITGTTQSTDFPTKQPLQASLDNQSCTSEQPQEQCNDGFVTKLDRSGRALVFSTYLGGRAEDQGLAVAIDASGNAYVGGRTDSRDFVTRDAVQPRFGGYIDGFATSLTPRGALRWSTFLGGSEADRVEGIAVDPTRLVRVAGRTLSPDFPTVRPIQPTLNDADYDAFVGALK